MKDVVLLNLSATHSTETTVSYHHPDAPELGMRSMPTARADTATMDSLRAWIEPQLQEHCYRIGEKEHRHAPTLHWFALHVHHDGSMRIEAVVGHEGLAANESIYLDVPATHVRRVRSMHARARKHAGLSPQVSSKQKGAS